MGVVLTGLWMFVIHFCSCIFFSTGDSKRTEGLMGMQEHERQLEGPVEKLGRNQGNA